MCLDKNSHELIEAIWSQGRNVWNRLTAQLNKVMLAAQITIDPRDGLAGDAASKDISPRVDLRGQPDVVEKLNHLRRRDDKTTLWLVVIDDVQSKTSKELAQSWSRLTRDKQRLPGFFQDRLFVCRGRTSMSRSWFAVFGVDRRRIATLSVRRWKIVTAVWWICMEHRRFRR